MKPNTRNSEKKENKKNKGKEEGLIKKREGKGVLASPMSQITQ